MIRGLTIWQPFASYLAERLKLYETRSWYTPYRGPLAIHAAKRPAMKVPVVPGLGYDPPLGAIIAIGKLADCVRTEDVGYISDAERAVGDFSPGRFAWKIEDVTKLAQPIQCPGGQRLWYVTAAMAERLGGNGCEPDDIPLGSRPGTDHTRWCAWVSAVETWDERARNKAYRRAERANDGDALAEMRVIEEARRGTLEHHHYCVCRCHGSPKPSVRIVPPPATETRETPPPIWDIRHGESEHTPPPNH